MTDPQSWAGLSASWARSLRARNRSENTIYSYLLSAAKLNEFLGTTDIEKVTRRDLEAFLADQLATSKPATAAIRYRSLKQFFRWLMEEEEIGVDPTANLRPPEVPEKPVPVLANDQLRALLAACEGRHFDDRRDMALVRLFIATPCRLSEITNLSVEDLSLTALTVRIVGKGRKERLTPFGPSAAVALDRYLRVRGKHRYAQTEALWLGPKGPMTRSGVSFAMRRRARIAGIDGFHVHMMRHLFAHTWKAAGHSDDDLMKLAGWSSPAMLRVYARSTADERAREAYKRSGIGERV